MYSEGESLSRVKYRSPLAREATEEAMNLLKPSDKVLYSRMSELSGRNANERISGFENVYPEGRACSCGVKTGYPSENYMKRSDTPAE